MADLAPELTSPELAADCSSCFGLCCTALSFQRGGQFGHDKLAGEPCQYLRGDFRCGIHERREDLGYEGCIEFDCLGAGQRASAAFAGENWRRDGSVARRMHAQFARLLRLQEMRRALLTAGALSLPAGLESGRIVALAQIGQLADAASEHDVQEVETVLAAADAVLDDVEPFLTHSSLT